MVTEYLNSFLPYKVKYDSPGDRWAFIDDRYSIVFKVQYGEDSDVLGGNRYALIKQLLSEHFPGDNSFIVESGEDYN